MRRGDDIDRTERGELVLMDPWLWLALFVLLAYTVEATTGFGSIVIALSLGALVLPIDVLLPVLVPLNLFMSSYLGVRYRAHIHWPTLLKQVLPLMVLGTALGHGLKPLLSHGALQGVFGALVIGFAVRSLWQRDSAGVHHPLCMRGLLFGAGITHGLFASGGPLLVLALAGSTFTKAALRSTLIIVWFSLNSLLTAIYLIEGSLVPALPRTLSYLPVVLCGLLAGEWLHHRVDEQHFRQLVYGLLTVVGGVLVLTA